MQLHSLCSAVLKCWVQIILVQCSAGPGFKRDTRFYALFYQHRFFGNTKQTNAIPVTLKSQVCNLSNYIYMEDQPCFWVKYKNDDPSSRAWLTQCNPPSWASRQDYTFLLLQQIAVQSSILFLSLTVDKILQTCSVVKDSAATAGNCSSILLEEQE